MLNDILFQIHLGENEQKLILQRRMNFNQPLLIVNLLQGNVFWINLITCIYMKTKGCWKQAVGKAFAN